MSDRSHRLAWRLSRALLASGIVLAPAAAAFTRQDPIDPSAAYAATLREIALEIAQARFTPATALLESCDPSRRGFEWNHLSLCLDVGRAAGPGPGARAKPKTDSATTKVLPVSVLRGHDGVPSSASFAPAGDVIASCGKDRTLRLWSAKTGDCRRVVTGLGGAVLCCAIDPTSKRVVAGSEDGLTRVVDVASGDVLLVLRANGGAVRAVCWSTDAAGPSRIVTGSIDGSVRLWNAASSEPRFALHAHAKPVNAVAFSPDGRVIASGSDDGSVRTWDAKTGDPLNTFADDENVVSTVAFDPSGALLASAGTDKIVRLRDAHTGAMLHALEGSEDAVESLSFTADGKRLATAGRDGSVRIWEVASGAQLLVLRGHEGAVHCVVFGSNGSARGDRLLSAGEDKTLRLWETDAAVARAAQREAVAPLPTIEAAADMRPSVVDAITARLVQRPGLAPRLYEDAAALALATTERIPESGAALTTLGGAQYRLGKYDEAFETLTRAGEKKRGLPANLAFRAMTLAHLDREDDAKNMLARLTTLLKEDRWQNDVEANALLEEASLVVAARMLPPGSAPPSASRTPPKK